MEGADDSGKLDALDGGAVRSYFVACEEVEWNYGPSGRNGITDLPFEADRSATYMVRNESRIGATNRKARYVEYTDASFATVREPSADWAHKGILGPVLRAEVGDQLHVLFRNKCSRPYTMHPHGVEYLKAAEGAGYADGVAAAAKPGAGVAPGADYLYKWKATERSGPGPSDADTVPWLYHSHVDEGRDVSSGLLGLLLVSRKGAGGVEEGGRVGRPPGVDRELVTLFKVFDESMSWCHAHPSPSAHAIPTHPSTRPPTHQLVPYSLNRPPTRPPSYVSFADLVVWGTGRLPSPRFCHSPHRRLPRR